MTAALTPVSPPRSTWKRFLWIGLALFVVAAVFLLWFWPSIELRLAINGLSTSDQRVLGDLWQRLRASTDPSTDERLAEAAADSDKSFLLRERTAELLIVRNRLVRVEELARSPDLMTRAVALKVLSQKERSHFAKDYVPAPEYRVEETVRAWLADPRLEARKDAISLAMQISLPDLMATVRPLLDRRQAEGTGSSDANYTLKAAVEAAVQYKDCASLAAVLVLAESDADWEVRRISIDALESFSIGRMGESPICPDALPRERIGAFLAKMLDAPGEPDFARFLRTKGLGLLESHPEWVPANAQRVWAVLRGDGNGAERRAALAALVAGKDPSIPAAFPAFFHDRNHEVRSTAVQYAGRVEGLQPEGLWLGILRDESKNFVAVLEAHTALRRVAGIPVGLPKAVTNPQLEAATRDRELNRFLQEQMQQGSSMGVDREKWAEDWFRWLAAKHGLEKSEDVEQALAARKAFRAAVDLKNVEAARAALATVPNAPAPLFLYEQAWLAAQP